MQEEKKAKEFLDPVLNKLLSIVKNQISSDIFIYTQPFI